MYRIPCTVYRVPSGVTGRRSRPAFSLFSGQSQVCMHSSLLYSGTSGQVTRFSRCRQRPSHVVSFGIWFFPILYQIRCFICLHLEIKHLTARHVFYFGARLRGVDRVSRFHHVFPGNDCLKQLIQGLFLEQLMRDLF